MSGSPDDVTFWLGRMHTGDPGALQALVPLVYSELRSLAHVQRLRHGAAETLNTTALLHEAYLKMSASDEVWANRRHFFRVAARVMRQVMVDYARRQKAAKRGGEQADLLFDEAWMRPLPDDLDLEALGLSQVLFAHGGADGFGGGVAGGQGFLSSCLGGAQVTVQRQDVGHDSLRIFDAARGPALDVALRIFADGLDVVHGSVSRFGRRKPSSLPDGVGQRGRSLSRRHSGGCGHGFFAPPPCET